MLIYVQSLQHASEQSGIEILIHELRTESQFQKYHSDVFILPGGESTTMRKTGGDIESEEVDLPALFSHLREFNSPVLGTCAGAILLCNPDA